MKARYLDRLDSLKTWIDDFTNRGPVWRAVRAVLNGLWKDDSFQLASAMAFDLFLALIPLLAVAGWIASSILSVDHLAMENLSLLLNLTPNDVKQVMSSHADRFNDKTVAPLAIAGTVWIASGAFDTMMAGFERTLAATPRPWWQRRSLSILCVVAILLAIGLGALVSVALAGGTQALLTRLPEALSPVSEVSARGMPYSGFLLTLGTLTLLLAGFFRIGVRRPVPKRFVWPGTLLTLALAALSSYLFAVYARSLAGYATYYGSLAAVAVILAWLWMCSLALLMGAELNAHLEDVRAHG
jgi:membrane protein